MREKRIFVFSGSCNRNSTTQYLIETLIKKYQKETQYQLKVDFFSGYNTNISDCIGCLNCFVNGKCVMDQKDDLENMKQAMQDADIIIMGSPVYFHGVSGVMKRFMDRISYWTHTMELTGKIGITVATSGGNGLNYVTDYLKKFYNYLGIQWVAGLEKYTYHMEYVKENDVINEMEEQYKVCVEQLLKYTDKKEIMTPAKEQIKIFQSLKKYNKDKEEYRQDIAEINRWYELGFHNCPNYQDAIKMRMRINNEV